MSFAIDLYKCLWRAQFTEFLDNYDGRRFGPLPKTSWLSWLKWKIRLVLRRCNIYRQHWLNRPDPGMLVIWLRLFPDLEWLYERVADDQSRSILVDVIAFRIMGYKAVRLPLGNQNYLKKRKELASLADAKDCIELGIRDWNLYRHDLEPIGVPIRIYVRNPMTLFYIEQYSYALAGIAANLGDVVIDGGGCTGDTALYFAWKAGPSGSVHSFEFVQGNLSIFRRNMDLNPDLATRVSVVENALWDVSDKEVHILERGPASRVSLDPVPGYNGKSKTITIDDYVEQSGLDRVDFIKLDIEGAEENALLGAENTIRRFRPTLAVCLYHSPRDFVALPRLIDKYCPDYQFYIKHCTMHAEETVLFAKVKAST